jgi:hypothetical protein
MFQRLTRLQNNEDGLVAIVITLIIMIVLTLIVTGFAQLGRQEQKEALDRQLNTQAFYAAESGINDARRALKTNPTLEKPDCNTSLGATAPPSQLGSSGLIQYTCVIVSQKLPDYPFQDQQINQSTVRPITPDAANDNLVISWQQQSGSQNIKAIGAQNLPPAGSWGDYIGVLRIDLVPVPTTGFTADSLRNDVFTAFLYPSTTGSGAVNYTSVQKDQGQIVKANCTSPTNKRKCSVTISGLSGNYYLRWTPLYQIADIDICPHNCDNTVHLSGLQSLIDSTGRANGVLKRLQVRVTAVPDYNKLIFTPEYTLDTSADLCKLLSVAPGTGTPGTCPVAP